MKQIRVLVAEDNEDHQFFIRRALEEIEGLTVDIAVVHNGAEALDYLYGRAGHEGSRRPHLVLLDLRMPQVTGLGVLEQMKRDPDLRAIPVTVFSSSDRPEDIASTYDHGGNTYVVKPVGFAAMRRGLHDVAAYWTEVAALPEAG